jgi:gamma-glutamyltranspeptidase
MIERNDMPNLFHGVVATPHSEATGAAETIYREGGNAIDAAVAAAAILAVVYPNQCSIGGDAIALVGDVDGTVTAINGTGRAARGSDAEWMRQHYSHMPVTGPHSVTVPGALSVWDRMSTTWGNLPLANAFARAADVAEDGVPVAPGVARDLYIEEKNLALDEGARKLFFSDDRVLRAGETLRNVRLGQTLRQLADKGANEFYNGTIAQSLADTLQSSGGYLDVGDFRDHSVDVDPAHSVIFQGQTYFSTGMNSQGIYFLQELGVLERLAQELDSVPDPLGADAVLVAKVLNEAAVARDKYLGDPATSSQSIDDVLGDDVLDSITDRVLSGSAPASSISGTKIASGSGDTVAIVTADSDGRWVSLIQSAFHAFGSTIVDQSTGVLLHNRGASFVLAPGAANSYTPGCRPPHTLMPVLAEKNSHLVGAHGTMGGRAQPQIHAHLALQIALGQSPSGAVSAPRWVLGQLEAGPRPEDDDVSVAYEDGLSSGALRRLSHSGFLLRHLGHHSDEAGHTQIVRRVEEDGALVAATDPRADGAPAVANDV